MSAAAERRRVSHDEPSPAARAAWLGVVLAIAVALRAFRLDWGLPAFTFFDSSLFYVDPAAHLLRAGTWKSASLVHPPATAYALAALARAWALVAGVAPAEIATAQLDLIGRVMTVGFSAASVAVLYALARRLVGWRAALLAAAALALCPVHVLEAHRVQSDAPMLLLSLVAAHQATWARDERRVGRLALAFAATGAAAAVKYTGLAAITVPAWIAATWPGAPPRRRAQLLVAGGALTVLVLAIGLAPLLARWDELTETLHRIRVVGMSIGQPGADLRGQGWVYARYVYLLVAGLPYVLGWAVYLAAWAGLLLVPRVARARGPVLAAVLPFFLFQGAAETVVPRYALPLAPWLCLTAGLALDRLWRRRHVLGATVAAAVLAYTLLLTSSLCLRIPGPPNAVAAALGAEIERAGDAGRPLVLGYDSRIQVSYDPLSPLFRDATQVRIATLPRERIPRPDRAVRSLDDYRAWLDREQVDAVLITGRVAGIARRENRTVELELLAALEDGRLGFRRAAVARTGYFTEQLYTWADPMLATDLAAGILDHELFVRAPAPPPSR